MHLGVNLRAAQVKALKKQACEEEDDENEDDVVSDDESITGDEESITGDEDSSEPDVSDTRKHHDIDKFVHEMVKLFGCLGTPEYCLGSTFRAFIKGKSSSSTYYESAQCVSLTRQVGSRYYVTSYNCGRLFFLKDAMLDFLNERKHIKHFNHLESACYQNLKNTNLLANAKLEGLLFEKVYADLMTLVKSVDLKKSVIDMNSHLWIS